MIEVRGLWKHYGEVCALRDVDFSLSTGTVTGLLGLNGAGKTTALRILAGDLRPSAGIVRIDGVDVVEAPAEARRAIGFLPEQPPLYDDMSVRGYLVWLAGLRAVPRREIAARVDTVAERVGIEGRLDDPIPTLSLGYRKRLGIAQALVHRPRLVLLDEPIAGLDPARIAEMRGLVRGLVEGEDPPSVLVSSHILTEVHETCDELLVLREGRLVAAGTESSLRARAARPQGLRVVVRGSAARAQTVLEAVPGVNSVQLREQSAPVESVGSAPSRRPGGAHVFALAASDDAAPAVARALVVAGLDVCELVSETDPLERIFLELAGDRVAS